MIRVPSFPARRCGGTDISAIMGLNPYRDSLDVYERIVLGKQEPLNPRMMRGTREEPRIREMAKEFLGWHLEPHPGVVQSKEHHFATVSPDDIAVDEYGQRVAMEYKSVSKWSAKYGWGQDGSDDVPVHYSMQVRWSMAVLNLSSGLLYASFGEDKKDADGVDIFEHRWQTHHRFERNEEIEKMMLQAGKNFWENHIVPMIPPLRTKPKKRGRK